MGRARADRPVRLAGIASFEAFSAILMRRLSVPGFIVLDFCAAPSSLVGDAR